MPSTPLVGLSLRESATRSARLRSRARFQTLNATLSVLGLNLLIGNVVRLTLIHVELSVDKRWLSECYGGVEHSRGHEDQKNSERSA